MSGNLRETSFGGEGGSEFALMGVSTLGLRTGSRVDAIIINGMKHGGDGGSDRGVIYLSDGEYICRVDVRSGTEVDYLQFTTNEGRVINGGGTGGTLQTLDNIKVVEIGGRSGARLDKITIKYYENFK